MTSKRDRSLIFFKEAKFEREAAEAGPGIGLQRTHIN